MQGLPSIGDIVDGNYEIKSLLGKGGFGAVFLARHIAMNREVALKLLIAQGPNPQEMIQRFRREVMAIRNLSHPNTVRIFDYHDSLDDSLLYYTMEYLRGENLKEIIRREGAQRPARVKHILKQVAKSLSEAHSLGIVHRDLKPANIMLADMHGEEDFVKVLDFGIAKLLEQDDSEEEPLTSAGMLVGTLRYMSPEQIKGEPVGPYTDLYALGLIALEMIMGESAFAGTGRWEVLQKQVSPEPIPLPNALLATPLGPVFQKLLSKPVEQRYASADMLARDLNAIPDHVLPPHPLLPPREQGDPQHASPSNSSSSAHVSTSSPSTPAPSQHISGMHAQHHSEVSALRQPVPAMADSRAGAGHALARTAPPMPLGMDDLTPPSTLASTLLEADASASLSAHSSGRDALHTPKPASRAPLMLGIGALLLLLGLGLAYIALNPDSPEQTTPPIAPLAAPPAATAPPDERSPGRDKVEHFVFDDPTPEEEPTTPPPREITLKVAKSIKKAQLYQGDTLLGPLPFTYSLPHGEQATLRVVAERHQEQILTLNETTEETLTVTLKRAKSDERTSDTTPPVETGGDWIPIDSPDRNKMPRDKEKKPKVDVPFF